MLSLFLSSRVTSPIGRGVRAGGESAGLSRRKLTGFLAVLATVATFSMAYSPPVSAVVPSTVSPVLNRGVGGVTADALPTVQIDGVAWSQIIVGTTVWVGGKFNNARPAGSAAGTNLTTRNNLLAYNLSTGALITTFAPDLNAQVKVVAASPDRTRVYVGGSFTTANGVTHNHLAAYDANTGALIPSFAPSLNSTVYALSVTNSTVYVGGPFSGANGTPRSHLAAFKASNGALTTWNPSTDADVNAMVVTPDGSKVVIGGGFTLLDGTTALGLGAVDTATGSRVTWNASDRVQDSNPNAAILSLSADSAGNIYGSGFVYGASGNLEGSFSAGQTNGDINWIEDCHGDTYGVAANSTAVYVVGHSHYCGNVGGFPQTSPTWTFHRTLSFAKTATGTIQHDPLGYHDWYGTPSPSLVDWFPELAVGTITGKTQAAWSVAANDQYVVEGGEFPKVNNKDQQGLVRFAVPSLATNKRGPQLFSAADTDPTVASLVAGTARVSIPTNWDPDDLTLKYQVYRDSTSAAVFTTTADSTPWNMPKIGFTDTGLTPGSTHKYRVVASDPDGNTATSFDWVSVTVSSAGASSAYSRDVVADGAAHYWRLGEPSGATAYDYAGYDDLTDYNTVVHGAAGAINADSDAASTFNGSSAYAATSSPVQGPNTFTVEAWFKTTSTTGGKIIGFGSNNLTNSTSYDRHIYMDGTGHVWFGVYNSAGYTINTSTAYNDGAWHYAVGTLSSAGLVFYVDGKRIGANTGTTVGQNYQGYWRVGGDTTWSGNPYFNGSIDDAAVYPTALTLTQVQQHFIDSGRVLPSGTLHSSFTSHTAGLSATFDGSTSTGSIAAYAWTFGDGATGSGVSATHTYAAAGTYPVTLTVTDNGGLTDTASAAVTVAAANVKPTASFTSSTSSLTASVNASASKDSDGTIASYAWTFGDGATGSGVTATHTYAAAGTYPVTLTVTDNGGLTGTATTSVSVASAAVVASDAFSRALTAQWGTADVGGAWTVTGGASRFAVDGSGATMTSPTAGVTDAAYLNSVSQGDTNMLVDVAVAKDGTGTGTYVTLVAHHSGTSDYRLTVRFMAGGVVHLSMAKIVAGTSTSFGEKTITGITYVPGSVLKVRFRVVNQGTATSLAGVVWASTATEPATAQFTASDSTAALQGPGAVGLTTYLGSTVTNAPVVVRFDSLVVKPN